MKNEFNYFRMGLILIIVSITLVFCFSHYSDRHANEKNCARYHNFIKEKIHGMIVKAYFDEDRHCFPMLIIKEDNGMEETRNILEMDKAEILIYNSFPGDSVSKEIGSNIIVVKSDSINPPFQFTVSYLCQE